MSDLISRVLDKGVVLSGDVILSVADIDLIKLELHLLISGIESLRKNVSEPDVPVLPDGS